jgi:hypothetical protein
LHRSHRAEWRSGKWRIVDEQHVDHRTRYRNERHEFVDWIDVLRFDNVHDLVDERRRRSHR